MSTSENTSAAAAPVQEAPSPSPVAKGDRHIWGIYIILVFIGLIELYSASSREVGSTALSVYNPILRHSVLLLVGLVIIWVLQRTHYRTILRMTPIFAICSVVLMILTLFIGETIHSATRSINLVVFSVQPSELLKISAAMVVALITARFQKEGGGVAKEGVIWSAGIILLYCALLAPHGLTNTLLLMSISGSMMIVGGIGIRKLAVVLLIYGACFGAYLGYTTLRKSQAKAQTELAEGADSGRKSKDRTGVWSDRLESYFGTGRPKYEEPITSDNRQEMLGYMAQANGGILGVAPGNSRETARLPLAFTDYIYAIIVEEMGLVGGIVVLVLYLWLLARASAIASRCSRAFPALLVIGMALTIVYQALFHICIVTGVIPVSGQPLPLISKGGTSVLVTSMAFGIMLSVSRFAVRSKGSKKDIKYEIEALPEDVRAENPTQIK